MPPPLAAVETAKQQPYTLPQPAAPRGIEGAGLPPMAHRAQGAAAEQKSLIISSGSGQTCGWARASSPEGGDTDRKAWIPWFRFRTALRSVAGAQAKAGGQGPRGRGLIGGRDLVW